MGVFSNAAVRRGWTNLETFFNPNGAFAEVHIVSTDDDYEYERTRFGTVIVHPLPSPRSRFRLLRAMMTMFLAGRRLNRLVREENCDLMAQIFGGPLKFGTPAVVVARRWGLPSIITLHNDYRRLMKWTYPASVRWAANLIWLYLFRASTAIRSVSEYIAHFAYECGVPQDKVTVIPNKEDLDRFRKRPTDQEIQRTTERYGLSDLDDAVVFLTAGRLIAAKNYEGMLAGFALAVRNRPHLRYVIAGEGPLRPRLERQIRELGLERHVLMPGFVPHEDLRCLYHLSDVFLFATHYEGQPRVAIEAILSGLPLICTHYGQICEIVKDGTDGVWVDPTDPGAIAAAIARLADDRELRVSLGRHASFDASAYSLERVGRQEAEFMLAVIRSHRESEGSVD